MPGSEDGALLGMPLGREEGWPDGAPDGWPLGVPDGLRPGSGCTRDGKSESDTAEGCAEGSLVATTW